MNFIKSYFVALDGEKKLMVPQGASAFAVSLIPANGDAPALVRVSMAVNDERPMENREIFLVPEDQAFQAQINVSYVGSIVDPRSTGRIPELLHVLVSKPAPVQPPRGAPRQIAIKDLPPELQEAIRKAQEQQTQQEQPAGDVPTGSTPSA